MIPASFAQEYLLDWERRVPGTLSHNLPIFLRLTGTLDVPALEFALSEITRRHAALRTVLLSSSRGAEQMIHPPRRLPLRFVDLEADYPGGNVESIVSSHADSEETQPFELSQGPLFRACLVRLSLKVHVLMLTWHHLIIDGWSFGLLKRELELIYTARINRKPSPLRDTTLQYSDFAAWQHSDSRASITNEHLRYWTTELDGSKDVCCPIAWRLPHDEPASTAVDAADIRCEIESFILDTRTNALLGAQATQFAVTKPSYVLSLFLFTVSALVDNRDLLIRCPFSYRPSPEFETVVGLFVHHAAVRVRRIHDRTLGALITDVAERCWTGMANGGCPLLPIMEMSASNQFPIAIPLRFNYVGSLGARQLDLGPDIVVSRFRMHQLNINREDLLLAVREFDNGLACEVFFRSCRFSADNRLTIVNGLKRAFSWASAQSRTTLATTTVPRHWTQLLDTLRTADPVPETF